MDIVVPNQLDERRIEVLANGLPLFHGVQVPVDMVSALWRMEPPTPVPPTSTGLLWRLLVAGKSSGTPSSLPTGQNTTCCLWGETFSALGQSQSPSRALMPSAWLRRWQCMLACGAAQACALSLLDHHSGLGSHGHTIHVRRGGGLSSRGASSADSV